MDYIEAVKQPTENHYNSCYSFALKFLKSQSPKSVFTSEHIIAEYNLTENPIPKEGRVCGAVIKKLKVDGLIKFAGYVRYENPLGHGKPCNSWVKN
jgi:hypothetical protein